MSALERVIWESGWVDRADMDDFPVLARRHAGGPLVSFATGFQAGPVGCLEPAG
jgi:hypothetical protein